MCILNYTNLLIARFKLHSYISLTYTNTISHPCRHKQDYNAFSNSYAYAPMSFFIVAWNGLFYLVKTENRERGEV